MGLLRTAWFWLLGVGQPGSITGAEQWQWYAASPAGMVVLGVLAALAVAAAMVNLFPRSGMPWRSRLALTLLRLVVFALLALLLVQLELRVTVHRSLPPNVAVLTDTSGSMALRDVGKKSRIEAARDLASDIRKKIGRKAHLANYDLNWKLRAPDEKVEPAGMTRIMGGMKELLSLESDLQAAILLSDGNDTAGDRGAAVAPLFAARGVPVYPVTVGSPDVARMPVVKFTGGGDYIRLGDELRLEATLSARDFEGQIVRAGLYKDGSEQPLMPPQEGIRIGKQPAVLRFAIKPEKAGTEVYRIVVDGIRGASTEKLLVAEHTVDVIDQPIRVLYVDVPRDERKIVGHWLARDPVIDFAGLLKLPKGGWFAQGQMRHTNKKGLPDEEADLNEYDVVILGDIPRAYFREGDVTETGMGWLVDFVKRRGGGLVTMGGRSVYSAGNYEYTKLASILPFTVERKAKAQATEKFPVMPTPMGMSHPVMMLERDFEGNRSAWFELPQVEGCNLVGTVKPGASLLAVYDKGEGGQLPVIASQNVGKGRVLSLTIDTTWRWEMMRERGSEVEGIPEGTDYFRRFWGNAMRYLAPDPRLEPERPQISRKSSDAAVGQTVTLTTRLVDRVYKPISKADLTIRVKSPSGKTVRVYPADGRSKAGVYEYEVTFDEPGTWEVSAVHKEKEVLAGIRKAEEALQEAEATEEPLKIATAKHELEMAKAEIAAEKIVAGDSLAELEDPRAKPGAMSMFAEATKGRAFGPEEIGDLVKELNLFSHNVTESYAIAVWNLPSVMILIILLVSLDCLIRKRRGLV